MFIDSHAHLDMEAYEVDRKEVLDRAFSGGVDIIMNVACDLDSSRKSVALSQDFHNIYASVGVHPHDAISYSSEVENELIELAKNRKVLGIGEIGLDYHYDNSPRNIQRKVFVEQLRLACRLNMPVIIHFREAEEDFMEIVSQNSASMGGVIHCFSGDENMAGMLMEMGYYLSFGGPVTYKKSSGLERIVRAVPIEKMLIETDCPYLTPVPFRGKRNEPSNIGYVASRIAEIKELSIEDVARITSVNFKTLFGLNIDINPAIAYRIRDSLYLNITNRCSNACGFCARNTSYMVKGHFLKLIKEPTVDEIVKNVDAFGEHFSEVVFCGFGEPTVRLDDLITISGILKAKGLKVRINTNGHADLIAGKGAAKRLQGLVDAVSISLNAADAKTYYDLCRPRYGRSTFDSIIEFTRECKKYIPDVTLTVVEVPEVNVEECRGIAENIGVKFRVRRLNDVG